MGWSSIMLNLAGRGRHFRFCLQRERLVEEKKRVQTRLASRLSLEGVDTFDTACNASVLPEKRTQTRISSGPSLEGADSLDSNKLIENYC